jgi:hypothetical protein
MNPSSLERNDISVEKLFEWSNKFTIKDRFNKDKLEVFIRLVGDADLNRARVYGLRKSADMRKKLKDLDSDQRIAYIPDISVIDKDGVINTLLLYRSREFATKAVKEVQVKIPKEPDSEATLEEQEKYQEFVDNYLDKRQKEIDKYVAKLIESERKKLEERDLESLYKDYENEMINQICNGEMVNKYREFCTFCGTYKDSKFKKRLFESLDEFLNLPSEVKDQLTENYLKLEVGGEDLKNLPEATP